MFSPENRRLTSGDGRQNQRPGDSRIAENIDFQGKYSAHALPLPPKELELTPDLRAGKCNGVPGVGTYRVSDARVGDHVQVDYSWSQAGVWTCHSVTIVRRPNGKVPEASADPSAKFRGYAWHERCQAHQDFEEKGTPIPLKFLPDYKDRVAPMPREAKPKP